MSAQGSENDGSRPSGPKRRVIVISGPTAVGKSNLAMLLAKRIDGEIVSADSVQVYRGLDIGSSKSTPEEQQEVPHHLLDIVSPSEDYSAGDFHDDARRVTEEVLGRGRVPIVVGGTGLYLRWYLYGKPDTPRSTPEQAAEIEAEIDQLIESVGADGAWDSAVSMLAEAGDPVTAAKLARNDWYRLRRAWEILKVSGRPRAEAFHGSSPANQSETDAASVSQSKDAIIPTSLRQMQQHVSTTYDFHCYFAVRTRESLYRRIDQRCEEMVAAGMLKEASWMLDQGIHSNSSPPSRAIGYRQAMEYLENCRAQGGESSHEEFLAFLDTFQQASRNYAKRQMTWFRGEEKFLWVDAEAPEEVATSIVERFMAEGRHDASTCQQGLGASNEVMDDGSRGQLGPSINVEGIGDACASYDNLLTLSDGLRLKSYKEAKAVKGYRPRLVVYAEADMREEVLSWLRLTQKQTC